MDCGIIRLFYVWCLLQICEANGCNLTIAEPGRGTVCYNIVDQSLTRADAARHCYDVHSGSVVTVTSARENDLVYDLMQRHRLVSVWLGGREHFTSWRWLDGRETSRQGCFHDDISLTDFIERNTLSNNTFVACEERCQEQRYLYGGLQEAVFCWCGNSFGNHGHFESGCNMLCPGDPTEICGGETANAVFAVGGTYSNWLSGQPNNHLGYQTCTVIEPESQYQWLDVACSDRQAVLCHIDDAQLCNDLTIADPPGNITEQYKLQFTDTSCLYINLQYATWFDARQECRDFGGDLLIVDSTAVTDMVSGVVGLLELELESAGLWIGLQRSQWRWDTYEPMGYTNWADSRPNGADQSCAVMSEDGSWDDVQCAGYFSVICETDSAINYDTTTTAEPTTTQSTVSPTTTKARKPPRTKPRIHESEKGISDEHMAAIVAGGVVMLVVIIIVTAVYCFTARRDRKKKREEEEEMKREKYFFGLDGDIGQTTIERSSNTQQHSEQTPNSIQLKNTNMESVHSTIETAAQPVISSVNSNTEANPQSIQHSVISSTDETERRLSGKPDVIPH